MSAKHTKPIPYTLPPNRLFKPILICGVVMAFSASKRIISPGSLLYDYFLSHSATTFKAVSWLQNGLFWFLYVAHAIESVILAKKLNENGVSVLSGVWWKWIIECYIGGQFCFKHFEDVVKTIRAQE